MDQTALHFLRYPFSHGYEYLPKTIIIILFETLLWRIIDIDCCIYTFIFSLIIAIYLETDKDHLRSFHLILNRYFNLSLISGCFLLLASISYFLYGYWISSILVFSVLIYSSMSSLPKMFFPYDILVFLIRICSLSLYLYLFPALLKEIAYILSLFMPSFLLQISHLSGYYLFLATTIFVLDVQDKMINSVTLSRALQVYRLRKKERGILEYINNYIDKVKASDIPITPFCQCQNSGLKVNNSGWCESCGLGLVPGVMLPPWTSGNPEINRIIFHTQIKSNHIFDHIEWINYDRFTNVKKIIKGARGDGYSASWIDGPMCLYGMARNGEQNVIIKSLGKSSSNVTPEFLRELESYVKLVTSYTELRYELLGSVQCYGLTRDPNTQEYMLVTEYIKGGDLRNYLSENFKNMKWLDHKLKILISIAKGLKLIHESGFIHQDLHLGNVLIGNDGSAYISDLGLYPFITLSDQDSKKESTPKGIFGVLPYVAPEVLERILPYTKESDIYSFGIIMWTLSSGKLPFSGCPFNTSLALEICNGERPEINIDETPQCYIDLMKRCWDSEPHKRPNIQEIYEILFDWYFLINEYEEFKKFDEMIKSDIEKKSTIFESDDVVHYSQFIDLDAISKEETFEVLDDDDLYSAKPYNIGTPSDVSTN